jgi:hypothetical protein
VIGVGRHVGNFLVLAFLENMLISKESQEYSLDGNAESGKEFVSTNFIYNC